MKHLKPQEEENPLQRWSRRKHAAQAEKTGTEKDLPQSDAVEDSGPLVLTDADMPPVETLDEHSDYSGFLSPGVSEELRKLALRKLFHLPSFSVRDGLDDYDGDYTEFAKLGDLVTADMKHVMEVEAKRKLEQMAALDEQATAQQEQPAEVENAQEKNEESLLTATTEETEAIITSVAPEESG